MNISRSRSRLKLWFRETGSEVPSRVSLPISILRLNLALTYGIPLEFRDGVYSFIENRHTPSGQSRTDGIYCREFIGTTGPVDLKVV